MRESIRLLAVSALMMGDTAYAIERPAQSLLLSPQPDNFLEAQPRPEFEPEGVDLPAGLILRPEGRLIAHYDDNVYRVRDGARGDGALEAVAGLDLRHGDEDEYVAFHGVAGATQYKSLTHENHVEYSLGLEGRAAPSNALDLAARFADLQLREERGSAENVRETVQPVIYSQRSGIGEARYDFGSSYLFQGVHYDDYIYGFTGGLDDRDRDRREVTAITRIGHDLDDDTSFFFEGRGNLRDYHLKFGFDGFEHSSSGYGASVGVHYEVTGVSFLDAAVGWLAQNYADPRFHPVGGLFYQLKLTWYPTDLVSISLNGEKRIEETDAPGVSGLSTNAGRLRFAFDLDENLIAGLGLGFADIAYRGTTGHDQVWDAGANLRYLAGPNLYLTLGWTGLSRRSNLPGLTYRDNQLSLDVSTQW